MFNGQPPGYRLVPTDYAPAMRALYGKGAVPPPRPSAALLRVPQLCQAGCPGLTPPGRLRPKAWCLGCSAQAPQPRRPRWQLMARSAARATAADLTALERAGALY